MNSTTISYLLYSALAIYAVWAIWWGLRPAKNKKGGRGHKATLQGMLVSELDDRFNQNTEFCPFCFTHQYWYRGGGSWSPDRCPYHPKSDEFILWKQMDLFQRNRAARKFDQMWFDKYGVHYFSKEKK